MENGSYLAHFNNADNFENGLEMDKINEEDICLESPLGPKENEKSFDFKAIAAGLSPDKIFDQGEEYPLT